MNVLPDLFGFTLGLLAVVVAMRVRRDLAARLGREWRLRFMAVQGVPINLALFAVWHYLAANLGWWDGQHVWWLALAYTPVFFFYSLSNIDWTARKFHGVES